MLENPLQLALLAWATQLLKSIPIIYSDPSVRFVIDVAFWVVLPGLVLAVLRKSPLGWQQAVGLKLPWAKWQSEPGLLAILTASILGYWIIAVVIGVIMFRVVTPNSAALLAILPIQYNYSDWVTSPGMVRWLWVFYLAATAAIVEEAIYRGLLARRFLDPKSRQPWAYLAISTLMFSSVHWATGGVNLIYAGLWGVFSAIWVIWSGRIGPLIIGHLLLGIYIRSA